MAPPHVTYLNPRHPFFQLLTDIVYPQLGASLEHPRFGVTPLAGSPRVYLFSERSSQAKVIAKNCFLPTSVNSRNLALLHREYEHLVFLRGLGFCSESCRVPRPLGNKDTLTLGLVQEWEPGSNLDYFLHRAIYRNDGDPLYARLEKLAFFLAELHRKTPQGAAVDWSPVQTYYQKVLAQLGFDGLLSPERKKAFFGLIGQWLPRLAGLNTNQVLVHGDATPTNFIFPSDRVVVAIDLERVQSSDPVWDLGMVCGEIKHAFLWRRRDPLGAEPFIRHFLETYAVFFPEPGKIFRRICLVNPFIMAVTELRIARNSYLDRPYRRLLIEEAQECLRGGLIIP